MTMKFTSIFVCSVPFLWAACDQGPCPPIHLTVNNRSTKPIADLQVCMGERCAIEVQLPAGGFVMSSMRAPGNAKPLLRWHLDGRGLQRHADVEVGRLTTGTLELGIAEDGKVTVEKQQLERGPLGCYWKE